MLDIPLNNHEERMLLMFDDVASFHVKFGIPAFGGPLDMPADLLQFRHAFLKEEASEIRDALVAKRSHEALDGFIDLAYVAIGTLYLCSVPRLGILGCFSDLQLGYIMKLAEGLPISTGSLIENMIDLSHACRNLSLARGYDFDTGWDRVHAANMKKVRATDANGKRKSQWDVVKPEGWVAPNLEDLVP